MNCEICKEPLDPREPMAQSVTSWEIKRSQGGANQLVLPERHQKFAHRMCVELAQRGLGPFQRSLIDDANVSRLT